MHSTNSFLYTVLERIRGYLDDPDFDAKYDNDYLVRHIICPTMVDVWSRINMNLDNPVVLRHAISITTTAEYYILPPCISEIWRIARRDTDGDIVEEIMPRNEFNPDGLGWAIEGNVLRVDPKISKNNTFHIYYVPNGDIMPHYATAGTLGGDRKTFTLATSTTLGALDRRQSAYAGQTLRIIPSSGKIEERIIETHDVDTGEVVTRLPFEDTVNGDVTYEIAPTGMQSLYEAIAAGAAVKLGAYRKITQAHAAMITQQYRSAIKTATDNLANLQMRTGKYWQKNTVDNPAYNDIDSFFSWHN